MNNEEIVRSGTTARWSDTVAWNGLLFLCEVPEKLDADIAAQAREMLGMLAKRLADNDSAPERLLSVTIYLPQAQDLARFNEIWEAWLPTGCAPVRACIHAALTNPLMRVEIQAMAARRHSAH